MSALGVLWPQGLDQALPQDLPADQVLGELRFGKDVLRDAGLPCVLVRVPTLLPEQPWRAVWWSGTQVTAGQHGAVSYRHDGHMLFGAVRVDQAEFAPSSEASALQQAAEQAYREIFAALQLAGYPGLFRVWNFIPAINRIDEGIERYRQFNIGRHLAFAACGQALTGRVPAASALGVTDGALEIGFIATRCEMLAVENPRQVSAYHYPQRYGPRSPTFSRAAVARHDGQDVLFISGTASIVGHESLHHDDVEAQTAETLTNIEMVLDESARLLGSERTAPDALACLAYVRAAGDLPRVRLQVQRVLGGDAQVCYVEADVCRAELKVEIEASGGHPIRGAR